MQAVTEGTKARRGEEMVGFLEANVYEDPDSVRGGDELDVPAHQRDNLVLTAIKRVILLNSNEHTLSNLGLDEHCRATEAWDGNIGNLILFFSGERFKRNGGGGWGGGLA